jgi:hypothetical protein
MFVNFPSNQLKINKEGPAPLGGIDEYDKAYAFKLPLGILENHFLLTETNQINQLRGPTL